ncbi:50S ribosomal protein L24 [Janibacter corallicola]|uniref:50S ribosomal protein L24 n=1 Tax=Janibacter corallicola TaxID=415212 RepID=UPI000835D288|nr:50S ribosomal protein L24 [Janibacter corallicola]
MAKLKIKKGDLVQVLSGRDKGLQGKVISVDVERERVVVEGVQRVTKHTRAGFGGQAGGLVTTEAPIHVSNVAVVDPEDNKPTRTRTRVETIERDGRKKTSRTRVGVRSGKDL